MEWHRYGFWYEDLSSIIILSPGLVISLMFRELPFGVVNFPLGLPIFNSTDFCSNDHVSCLPFLDSHSRGVDSWAYFSLNSYKALSTVSRASQNTRYKGVALQLLQPSGQQLQVSKSCTMPKLVYLVWFSLYSTLCFNYVYYSSDHSHQWVKPVTQEIRVHWHWRQAHHTKAELIHQEPTCPW